MEPLELVRALLGDPLSSALFSAASFLTGLLLGNWIAIGRDKRKEFNETARLIRAGFLRRRDKPTPYDPTPSLVELDLFMQQLPRMRRQGFRMALDRYDRAKKAAYSQEKEYGQVFYRDTRDITRCIDAILAYTRLR